MVCKVVMYHYVRPQRDANKGLYFLEIENFIKQLDFFETQYGFVGRDEWENFVQNQSHCPSGVLLTFDDGLIDHYNNVLPILNDRGIWAMFFVSSLPLNRKVSLSVHKVHYLLSTVEPKLIADILTSVIRPAMLIPEFFEGLPVTPYENQELDIDESNIKKIFNYALKPSIKDKLIDSIFSELGMQGNMDFDSWYMSDANIKEMVELGYGFGAHGATHTLLTKLNRNELRREIKDSIETLDRVSGVKTDSFCYPYGGKNSWNDDVLDVLHQNGIKYAFDVRSSDIDLDHLRSSPLLLPRYDCNEFPHGKASH